MSSMERTGIAAGPSIVVGVSLEDDRISYWSPGAEAYFGLSGPEAVGAPSRQIVDWHEKVCGPDAAGPLRVGDRRMLRHVVSSASGRTALLETAATVALDAEGRCEVLYTSAPARRGQVADIRPVRQLRSDAVADFTAYCDRRMMLSYLPPSTRENVGWTTRDILGHASTEYLHAEDREVWERAWDAVIAQPEAAREVEVRWLRADGEWRWFVTRLTNRLEDPEICSIVTSSRDVTEQRAAERRAAVAERSVASLLAASGEGVWVVDLDGASVYANDRAVSMLDCSQSQMRGATIEKLLGPAVSALVLDGDQTQTRHLEVPSRGALGLRQLRIGLVPRLDAEGRPFGTVLLLSDTTAERAGSGDVVPAVPEIAGPTRARSWSRSAAGVALTRREVDVVELLLDGDRAPAIADALGIRPSSVRNCLAGIYRKTGVHSQQQLVDLLRPERAGSVGRLSGSS